MKSDDGVVVERRDVVVSRQAQFKPYNYAQAEAERAANQSYNNVYYSYVDMVRVVQAVYHSSNDE